MQKFTFERYSQKEVINGIKNNDSKIIRIFYQSEYRKLEQFVLGNQGTQEDAKDIFQEAFVVLWKNIRNDKFLPENETAVAGYLYQIAKNKWLDRLRSNKDRFKVDLDENLIDSEIDNSSEKEEKHHMVINAFQNLGETCKDLLKRFYFQKESMEQIASAFDWTPATARNNKYRCIQRMKEMISK